MATLYLLASASCGNKPLILAMARFLLLSFLLMADAIILLVMGDTNTTGRAFVKPQVPSLMDPHSNSASQQLIGKQGSSTKPHIHQFNSLNHSLPSSPNEKLPTTPQFSNVTDGSEIPKPGKKQFEALSTSHHISRQPSTGNTAHETQVGTASITQGQGQEHNNESAGSMDQPVPVESRGQQIKIAKDPANRRLGKHHSMDKSIAGGGVIIGGLATTFVVSIICYIRATRRRSVEAASLS